MDYQHLPSVYLQRILTKTFFETNLPNLFLLCGTENVWLPNSADGYTEAMLEEAHAQLEAVGVTWEPVHNPSANRFYRVRQGGEATVREKGGLCFFNGPQQFHSWSAVLEQSTQFALPLGSPRVDVFDVCGRQPCSRRSLGSGASRTVPLPRSS